MVIQISDKVFHDDNFIICPHCEKLIKDAWDYGLDRYFEVIECPYCENEFEAMIETSYTYYSRKKEDSDEN